MEQISKQKQWLLEKYVSYFFIYSFIGWVLEVIMVLFQTKELENRGFINLPFLPIYGFGAVAISMIFKNDDYQWFKIAFVGGVLATLLELGTSILLEKAFAISLWDYGNMQYTYEGRISLLSTVFFMIGSVIIIKVINPIIERKIRRLKYNSNFEMILGGLCIITFIDFVYTLFNYIN